MIGRNETNKDICDGLDFRRRRYRKVVVKEHELHEDGERRMDACQVPNPRPHVRRRNLGKKQQTFTRVWAVEFPCQSKGMKVRFSHKTLLLDYFTCRNGSLRILSNNGNNHELCFSEATGRFVARFPRTTVDMAPTGENARPIFCVADFMGQIHELRKDLRTL